ncbi:MAG: molybdate ABC transporter substrate-binding protein [Microthrixaceae bacterium]
MTEPSLSVGRTGGPRGRTYRRGRTLGVLLVALALVFAGCSSDDSSADSTGNTTAGSDAGAAELSGSITVSAAASLTDVFDAAIEDFTAENPDTEVVANYGSSSQLAEQILAGAPADVAAFANTSAMDGLVEAGVVDEAQSGVILATNELVIITKPGNPEGIDSVDDLTDVGTVALCAQDAPCGRYAAELLTNAGVTLDESTITRGQNATATLTAVTEGDAAAAILYRSDGVRAAERAEVVDVQEGLSPIAEYPIAVLNTTENVELADAFVGFLLSDAGVALLGEGGFGSP